MLVWKNKPERKPLILNGIRQVGKTWLLKEFGRLHYEETASINFEANERMRRHFESSLDLDELLLGLRIETGCRIEAGRSLIVFDEVQDNPHALAEQYVAQELALREDLEIAYWSADRAEAEVDFLIQARGEILPLEVKAAENLQAKSLRSYRDRYAPRRCYRGSLSPWRHEEWLDNLPLYGIGLIER